nr:MAG TPA: hypothetical protein [Caudoviricetes sp.]
MRTPDLARRSPSRLQYSVIIRAGCSVMPVPCADFVSIAWTTFAESTPAEIKFHSFP